MTLLSASLFIGVAATLLFDLWGGLVSRVRGTAAPDWGLPGRWFGHMAQGRFGHDDIAAATPIAGETAIGWGAHYLIGVIYAAALVGWQGTVWLTSPTVAPALFVVVTVLAGWFVMSPGMGNGIAAARAETPWLVRCLQLAAHVVFGLGLWLGGLAFSAAL